MIKLYDRVREVTATTGTGAYLLAGATANCRTFLAAATDGDEVSYVVESLTGGGYEVGLGTYNATAHTVARTKIIVSSNANAAVNWTAGDKTISIISIAEFAGLCKQKHAVMNGIPGVSDDSAALYDAMSFRLDPAGPFLYICNSAAPGAADWYRIPLSALSNTLGAALGALLGGDNNSVSAATGAAIGGSHNTVSATSASVISGEVNTASASNAIVLGGHHNTASGAHGAVAGGDHHVASAVYSGILGGRYNTTSGNASACVGGNHNTASDANNVAIGGFQNTVDGQNNAAIGGYKNATAASAYNTLVTGTYAIATHSTAHVIGTSADFSTPGRNQIERLALALETANATPTDMILDGDAGEHLTIPAAGCWTVVVRVAAANPTAANVKGWQLLVLVHRTAAGAPAIVGSVTKTVIGASGGAAAWDVGIDVDAGNNALVVTCTGQAATTIEWTAGLDITQVTA